MGTNLATNNFNRLRFFRFFNPHPQYPQYPQNSKMGDEWLISLPKWQLNPVNREMHMKIGIKRAIFKERRQMGVP